MTNKDDFNRNADNQHIDWKKDSTELEPTLRRELEARENQRNRPTPTPEYSIGGSIEQQVHQQIDNANENKINQIRRQLKSIRKARQANQKEPERER